MTFFKLNKWYASLTAARKSFISEKYRPMGDFKPIVPQPDLKSCFIWFIAFLIIIGIFVGLGFVFKKW
jgi:hypothetical protein